MRTLQMGSRGDDVRQLQARLNVVGDYGLAEDGIFGAMTRSAVVRFQRANGLDADGIAGPITLGALGLTGATPSQPTPPGGASRRRRSLHIGINHVDPAHYDGWDGKLGGCENDAGTMRAIATRDGFTTKSLLSSQATSANILAEITSAAQQLVAGDVFLLTYAGHGGQVPSGDGDDGEIDQQDETWVAFDRMVIDNELRHSFTEFAPGVDILLLSDSCHSGTVYRRLMSPTQLEYAERKSSFYRNLAAPSGGGSRSFPVPVPAGGSRDVEAGAAAADQRQLFMSSAWKFSAEMKAGAGWAAKGPYVSIFDRFDRLRLTRGAAVPLTPRRFPTQGARDDGDRGTAEPVLTRNMPLGVNAAVVARHATLYSGLQAAVRGQTDVRANGVAISGCEDSQLSQEIGGRGVFTTAVEAVWNASSFTGTFRQFHQAILGRMGPTQTPELGLWGGDPESLVSKTPFG